MVVALSAPFAYLTPGCGARSDLELVDAPDAGADATSDATVDAPKDSSTDVPGDTSQDSPTDVPVDVPIDVPNDVPVDVPFDVPNDVPVDVPVDVPNDVPDGSCQDLDGDGYTVCDNDCDDANPLVNPGAFDFPNGVDDDCSGGIDDPNVDCDGALDYGSQDPLDYAFAIDLCQITSVGATGKNKIWGVIDAELLLANGMGAPAPEQHAIISSFGNVLGPRKNQSFIVLSSGRAATPSQPYFTPETPQTGTDTMTTSPTPQGFPTNKSGCPVPPPTAFNPVNLRLRVRVPTNARSFGFDHSFFSAEYPEYACSGFNDMWVALLKTGASGIANNHNIIFDAQGTPGSVNLNFFDRCVAGQTGCFGTPGFNFCSGGIGELLGTGYGEQDPTAPCGAPTSVGGGTGWITTEAPMLPGEVITLEMMLWDSSDGVWDSSAIVDDFHWLEGSLANPHTFR